jgi:predicted PurR-regulated permease PerM
MKREHIANAIFIALIIIVFYLFYLLLRPFLTAVIWGAVLAGIFYPVNARLARRMRFDNLRALIMVILAVAILIVPATLVTVGLVAEVSSGLPWLKEAMQSGRFDFVLKPETFEWNKKLQEFLGPYVDVSNLDLETMILENTQRVTSYLVRQTSNFVGNFSIAVVNFGLIVFAMFFMFRDGEALVARLKELLPMSDDLKANLTTRLKQTMEASIYGGVLVAVYQGTVGGLIFWIMGLPSPILWGMVMAFLSLIPIVGAYIVYIPAGVILILSGSWVRGIIFLILTIVIVSQTDNLVRLWIVRSRVRIHTLLLFFSILGGIKVFGLLGLVLGPVITSVIVTFVDVYKPPHPHPIKRFLKKAVRQSESQ